MKPVIEIINLSKSYILYNREPYHSLRDSIAKFIKNPFIYFSSRQTKKLWALKDINVRIYHGDVVGIIGKNGAGKSTLLKAISKITLPSEGKIVLRGNVASLLEVGTGFHPELTGRENIFLNGTILGMTKKEIVKKFDEIVNFAGLEKFIDTPVKYYSSGMYMRLGFSVAAHVQSDILIVDEVLAVGDQEFQKKCLGKINDVAKSGRTVLFVSHNLGAISSICSKGILLDKGKIVYSGKINKVLEKYYKSTLKNLGIYKIKKIDANKKLNILSVQLLKNGTLCTSFSNSDTLEVKINFFVKEKLKNAQIALELYRDSGDCIFSTTNLDFEPGLEIEKGRHQTICPINLEMLREGSYFLKLSSSIPGIEILDSIDKLISFYIIDNSSPVLVLAQNRNGIIVPRIKWKND